MKLDFFHKYAQHLPNFEKKSFKNIYFSFSNVNELYKRGNEIIFNIGVSRPRPTSWVISLKLAGFIFSSGHSIDATTAADWNILSASLLSPVFPAWLSMFARLLLILFLLLVNICCC